jgi:60 kDa SS-A/Ro ribonucleoprotein
MSSLNFRQAPVYNAVNAAGTPVRSVAKHAQLTRLVMANMLWEDQFYVDGKTTAQAIQELVKEVPATQVAALAAKARGEFKLRHVPLLLTRELARIGKLKAADLTSVIQRPDEMSEFLSIYWKEGKSPLSNQVKLGLAEAFKKFNEFQLAKWDKNSAAVSLRDVMFLTHPKPDNAEQEALFKKLANQELETPKTWETELSAGKDKAATFTQLMEEKSLGALAFLRNLRNMSQSGVDEQLIRQYGASLNVDKVLPFRFIAAARIVPQFEDMLEQMMFRALASAPKIPGKTVLLVDVSGSMFGTNVSSKSDLDRFDAAAALAVLCREVCEQVEIFSFSDSAKRVAPRRGFALIEAIRDSQMHGGTRLGHSLNNISASTTGADRTIVFTDEASYDQPGAPESKRGYILNVGAYQNGINHEKWLTITGFSEAALNYILAYEQEFK